MSTKDLARLFPSRSYLRMFFSEKDIPSKTFHVRDSQGLSHDIPNEAVVEAISMARGRELKMIEDTLRQLDFRNADINHFLEHLAKGLAEQYSGALRAAAGDTMSLRAKAIKLASSYPKGSDERKALLAALAVDKKAADPSVDREIKSFMGEIQDMRDKFDQKNYKILWDSAMEKGYKHYTLIGVDWGRKYARIWKALGEGSQRSVFCFVDRETGDILKGASWKKPAKHARGNVMDRAGRIRSVGQYGANYLR